MPSSMMQLFTVCAVSLFLLHAGGAAEAAEKSSSNAEAATAKAPSLDDDARPSIDALIDDFVAALGANDKEALTKLRVTESEYLNIIVPGTVPVGQPPRENSEKVRTFFWQMLNDKSSTYARQFLKRYGGRKYERTQLTFTEPTKHYSWYDAYGEVRLQMTDDKGNIWDLQSGFIAGVGGKYKFISYEYD